jgi:hypothetical protein
MDMIELEYFRQLKFAVLHRCAQTFAAFDPKELHYEKGYWQVGGIRLGPTMAESLKNLNKINTTSVYY